MAKKSAPKASKPKGIKNNKLSVATGTMKNNKLSIKKV